MDRERAKDDFVYWAERLGTDIPFQLYDFQKQMMKEIMEVAKSGKRIQLKCIRTHHDPLTPAALAFYRLINDNS